MSDSNHSVLAAIGELGIQIGRMGERLAQMDERLGRLETRVDSLKEEVTGLRVDMMARLDRQQDSLTMIKDDINVNIAATDNSEKRYKQFRDDYGHLSHQVSLVHRRLIQLEQRFDKEHGM